MGGKETAEDKFSWGAGRLENYYGETRGPGHPTFPGGADPLGKEKRKPVGEHLLAQAGLAVCRNGPSPFCSESGGERNLQKDVASATLRTAA